jgi:hypothetical protein
LIDAHGRGPVVICTKVTARWPCHDGAYVKRSLLKSWLGRPSTRHHTRSVSISSHAAYASLKSWHVGRTKSHAHAWSSTHIPLCACTLKSWSLRRYVKPPMMRGLVVLKPWVRELGCLGLRRNRRALPEDGDPRACFEEEEFCWLVVELGVGGRDESKRQGLNLSGSWQQGHSATYNTPSRI